MRAIRCATHGPRPWTGQVMCIGCGAVWHLNVDNPPTEDGSCTCGRKLSGRGGSARSICHQCYVLKKSQAAAGPS
jgi:hypothetical protein